VLAFKIIARQRHQPAVWIVNAVHLDCSQQQSLFDFPLWLMN
jgi:hypothetical protein